MSMLTWRGMPVPWTTAWSGEETLAVAPINGGELLVTNERAPGVGRPKFAHSHASRLYQALTQRLCSVCGEPMPEGWVCAVPMEPPGLAGTAELSEAPAHAACMLLACNACPALVERKPPVWAFLGWRVLTRLRMPPDALAAVRKLVPRRLAHKPLVSEVVYAIEGPVRHVSYEAFIAGGRP